jgi:hypothetical protein
LKSFDGNEVAVKTGCDDGDEEMSQRDSGYARKQRDFYETPAWVTAALIPHLRPLRRVWEPAAGSGKLGAAGLEVEGSDIADGVDFLLERTVRSGADAIITNPPYAQARKFIERALLLTEPGRGLLAMLLRTDYDHAKTRKHLFGSFPVFTKKLVLTERIVWFESPNAAPSFNHAWFIWDWRHEGEPTLAWTDGETR